MSLVYRFLILSLALLPMQATFADWDLPPTNVSNSGNVGDNRPNMGVSLNGHIVLAWFEDIRNVRASLVAPGSTTVGASTQLSGDLTNVTMISSSININGQAVVAWAAENGGNRTVEASYYNGTTWSSASTIAPISAGDIYEDVQSLIDENGNALVVWRKSSFGGTSLESRTYNATSATWAISVSTIASNSGSLSNQVAIQPNSGGNATIVFFNSDDTTLYAQDYTFAGGWTGINDPVIPSGSFVFTPSVQIAEDGTAVAAWRSNSDTIQTTSRVNGVWNQVPVVISEVTDIASLPIVKVNPAGDVIILWVVDDGTYFLYKAATGTAGSPTWVSTGAVSPTPPPSVNAASLGIDVVGNGIALWWDDTLGREINGSTLASGATAWVPTLPAPIGSASSSLSLVNVAFDNLGRVVAFFPQADLSVDAIDQVLFGNFFEINLAPLPPQNFTGALRSTKFSTQTEYNHRLQWNASPSGDVVEYRLYRNGVLIATIASGPVNAYTYNDHNRKKNEVDTYTLTAVNGDGEESTPLTIVL